MISFWLYQHGVKCGSFLSCKLLESENGTLISLLKYNSLQFIDKNQKPGKMKNHGVEYDSTSQWLQQYSIKVSMIGNNITETKTVGMTFHMQRYSMPFIQKYYIPCIVLILLTSVSFFVPPKLVPGRGGMLVTLFLVLNNIFSASKVVTFMS